MTAIVMNTLTGAVSEYSGFDFHAITPTQAGTATSLYTLGGDTDAGVPVVGRFETGKTLMGSAMKKRVAVVYFGTPVGDGLGTMTVHGDSSTYQYEFTVRAPGVSRCQPGKGIRESYLAFGFSKEDGGAFIIDKVEVMLASSNTRRI
jgi:hypothetical protein